MQISRMVKIHGSVPYIIDYQYLADIKPQFKKFEDVKVQARHYSDSLASSTETMLCHFSARKILVFVHFL